MKIIFNTENLNIDEQLKIKERIQEYFNNTKLELNSLQKVVISSNFFEDVIKTQKELGLEIDVASNNENAEAVAKVITSRKSKNIKSIIIANEHLISKISSSRLEVRLNGFHVIHHELAHVHDNYIKSKIFTDEERRGTGVSHLKHYLRVNADAIWSEYIAERLSAASATFDHAEMLINLFKLQGSNLNRSFELEQANYFRHKDTNIAFDKVSETMYYFLKTNLMIIGILDGMAKEDVKKYLKSEILKSIGESYFIEIFHLIKNSLSDMYSKYPNWKSIGEIDPLGSAIKDAWLWLGFKLVELDESYYRVDIRTN
ncbi:hypothetical protein [Peribacillus frigoritolerans]|uniref:hypothetical protein n=1 Tax=Peribacillus frigoritolerans TaxID=450367 RepID=UPI0020C03415|nr:hypothetical protein [Peribacillus frigoritolerans]